MNDHGSHARVGDFVETINPMGQPSGLYGVVIGEAATSGIISRRMLRVLITWNTGAEVETMIDSYVRIKARAET